MKKCIRDISILLISLSGVAALYRMYMKKYGPLVRVIAFHDVADKVWFESLMREIVTKHHPITPEQFHTKIFAKDKINILITFDDGYQSWIDNVLPVLQKFNLKGIFFINSGLVDVSGDQVKSDVFMKDRLYISQKRPLSWDGAKELILKGHLVGGHTTTHPDLTKLQRNDLRDEIRADKEKIEIMLSVKPQDFAYPFGRRWHYNQITIEILKQVGYQRSYTAEPGFYSQNNDFEIPRVCIENNQSKRSFNQWMCGAYDIFSFIIR